MIEPEQKNIPQSSLKTVIPQGALKNSSSIIMSSNNNASHHPDDDHVELKSRLESLARRKLELSPCTTNSGSNSQQQLQPQQRLRSNSTTSLRKSSSNPGMRRSNSSSVAGCGTGSQHNRRKKKKNALEKTTQRNSSFTQRNSFVNTSTGSMRSYKSYTTSSVSSIATSSSILDPTCAAVEIAELKALVAHLECELQEVQQDNKVKDETIKSLKTQIIKENDMMERSCTLQERLNEYLLSRVDTNNLEFQDANGTGRTSPTRRSIDQVVNKIHQWLFLEGIHFRDTSTLIPAYCDFLKEIGLPLERLFVLEMAENNTAYMWKWENGMPLEEHSMPQSECREGGMFLSSFAEPLGSLLKGRSMEVRMRANDHATGGCPWFTEKGYQDYYGLPMYHRGQFKGVISWTTSKVFQKDHLCILEQSLSAVSTVLRCYADEMMIAQFKKQLDEDVQRETCQLAAANRQLAAANQKIMHQAQQQLKHFAMMSHEIRTPLNCIVGLSNLLLDDDLDESAKESIEMITSSGDLLLAVVDDVLDYSKLATGNVKTVIQSTNLRKTIQAVVASVATKARLTNLDLRSHISPELPEQIQTDGRRLQQILYNLLGNAVKFGACGTHVDFVVENTGSHIRFSVQDYGKGIAPHDMSTIFEPFQQSDSNEPKHGGTGLGLAITRQLVRVLGGTIGVESDYGHWCRFFVELPHNPIPAEVSEDHPIPYDDDDDLSSFHDDDDDDSDDSTISSSIVGGMALLKETRKVLGDPSTSSELIIRADEHDDDEHSIGTETASNVSIVVTPRPERPVPVLSIEATTHQQKSLNLNDYAPPRLQTITPSSDPPMLVVENNDTHCSRSIDSQNVPREREEKTQGDSSSNGTMNNSQENPNNSKQPPCPTASAADMIESQHQHTTQETAPSSSSAAPTEKCIQATTVSSSILPEPDAPMVPRLEPATPGSLSNTDRTIPNDASERKTSIPIEDIRVLVAEDNRINQKVLQRTLNRIGMNNIEIVDNGKLAVDASANKMFDLIFMDVQMPVMDGLEATRIISQRKRDNNQEYPKIIFLTAHALQDYQEKAHEAGGDGFVSKPFKMDMIKQLVNSLQFKK